MRVGCSFAMSLSKHRGKFLQLHLTIEDEGAFHDAVDRNADLSALPRPIA